MKLDFRDIKETECSSDALILTLCSGEGIGPYKEIDNKLKGLISKVIKSGEFEGRDNQVSILHTIGRIRPERIALAGLGEKKDVVPEQIRQAGGRAASALDRLGLKTISFSTSQINSLSLSPVPFVEGVLLALYKFKNYKTEDPKKALSRLIIIGRTSRSLRKEIKWTTTVSSAVDFARDMINAPSNYMTPSVLADTARSIAKGRMSVKVLDRGDAAREGMDAYLSVARGSREQPKFIVLRYSGGKGSPIVLIGKSITFDSGGISIKHSEGMEKMKYDMAGGAAVLGVMRVASQTRLPLNIAGILPAAENLPGGSASKPGDIVRTIAGKSVEIISTDAEGRLTLADAMGYAKRFKPRAIIDIATLTGACSIALGNGAIAMMGNDDKLMGKLKDAGSNVFERVWQMPLYDEYKEYIKSDFADIKNSGGKTGSLVTAACFLKEFAGDTPWVHLDIAGTAWTDRDMPYIPKGATGIGVRLLSSFLKEMK